VCLFVVIAKKKRFDGGLSGFKCVLLALILILARVTL
jgi:hypothetical protein